MKLSPPAKESRAPSDDSLRGDGCQRPEKSSLPASLPSKGGEREKEKKRKKKQAGGRGRGCVQETPLAQCQLPPNAVEYLDFQVVMVKTVTESTGRRHTGLVSGVF